MPDPVPALVQVAEILAHWLRVYEPLSGWQIVTDQSPDIALDVDQVSNTINIAVMGASHDTPFSSGDTFHSAQFVVEAISDTTTYGSLNTKNLTALAHVANAIAIDSTLGGRIQDILPVDTAGPMEGGKDVGSATLRLRAEFNTPTADWFTLSD